MNNQKDQAASGGQPSAPMFGAIAGLQGLGSLRALREQAPNDNEDERVQAKEDEVIGETGPQGLARIGEGSGDHESVFSQPALTSSKEEETVAQDQVTYEMKTNDKDEAKSKELPPPIDSMFTFKLPGLGSKPSTEASVAAEDILENQEADKNQAVGEQPKQVVQVNKSGLLLSSLESNANSYLNLLKKKDPVPASKQTNTTGAQEQRTPVVLPSLGAQPNIIRRGDEGGGPNDLFPALLAGGGAKPIGLPGLALASQANPDSASRPLMMHANFPLGKPIILPTQSLLSKILPLAHKPGDLGGNFDKMRAATYSGEIIPIPYHTYTAIETLAPLVAQDENLSVTLNSSNMKIFENPAKHESARSLMCFVETTTSPAGTTGSKDQKPKGSDCRNNITFLVNQTDQIQNVLSGYHAKGKLQGTILDFTTRKFRYLHLLYAKSITILDFKDLLQSNVNDIQIVQSIQLNQVCSLPNQLNEFNFMEVTDTPDQSLLLFTDIASRKQAGSSGEKAVAQAGILHIDCSQVTGKQSQTAHKQTLLQFGSADTQGAKADLQTILDVEIWDKYLAVLTEKNTLYVFDVTKSSFEAENQVSTKNEEAKLEQPVSRPIFKAVFNDSTEQISQVFFVQDFMREREQSGLQSSEESDSQPDPSKQKLKGNFILLETKAASSKSSEGQPKESLKQQFRKLHIVQIHDKIGNLNLQTTKAKKFGQLLEQIDMLAISDQVPKFLSYDRKRGIVFLLNKEKSDRMIKFYSIKLKREISDDSESDRNSDDALSSIFQSKLRFYYVTEYRLQIGNSSFSAIQKVTQGSKSLVRAQPCYANILTVTQGEPHEQDFFLYTNILDQVIVFQRSIGDVTPSGEEMAKVLSSGGKAADPGLHSIAKVKSFNDIDENVDPIFKQLNQMALPEAYKQKIFQQSKDLGGKPLSDQDAEDDEGNSLRDDNQENENMVNDLLDGDSDKPQKKDIMQQIEEECKLEALQDAELLQQRITEEIRQTIGLDEDAFGQEKERPRDDDHGRQYASGNFVYQRKRQGSGEANKSGSEDSEDNNQKPVSKKQRRKERKQQEKKNPGSQSAFDKASVLKKQVDQMLMDDSLDVNDATKLKAQTSKEDKDKKKKATGHSKQGEQIVENFQELTRKYQELAQKINQLYQQVNRQDQQKIELESSIQKSIKDALSLNNPDSMLTQQIKEIVVPILTQKMRGLDAQINRQVLPHIEQFIENLFQSMLENMPREKDQLGEQDVKQIVVKEFRDAMNAHIVPKIEQTLTKLVGNLQKPMQEINQALCEKLSVEEDRNENMINYYQNSLERLLWIHSRMGMLSQQQLRHQMQQQISAQQDLQMKIMEGPLKMQIDQMVQQQVQQQMQHNVQNQVNMYMQQNVQAMVQQQVQAQMQQYNQQQTFMAPPLMAQQQSQSSFGTPAAAGTASASFGITPFNSTLPPQQSVTQPQGSRTPMRSFSIGPDDMLEAVGDPQALMNELKAARQAQKAAAQLAVFKSQKSSQQQASTSSHRASTAKQATQVPKNAKHAPRYHDHIYEELGARRAYNDGSEIDIAAEAQKPRKQEGSDKWDKSVDDDSDPYGENYEDTGNTYADDARIGRATNQMEGQGNNQNDDARPARGSRYEMAGARRVGPAAPYQAGNTRPYDDASDPQPTQPIGKQSETERQLEALIDKKFEAGRERQRRDMQRQFQGFGGEGSPADQSTGRERQLQRHPFALQNEPVNSSMSASSLRQPYKGPNEGSGGRPGQARELKSWKDEKPDSFKPFGTDRRR